MTHNSDFYRHKLYKWKYVISITKSIKNTITIVIHLLLMMEATYTQTDMTEPGYGSTSTASENSTPGSRSRWTPVAFTASVMVSRSE